MQSFVKGFEDNSTYVNPALPGIYQLKKGDSMINSKLHLLEALEGKAEAFYGKWKKRDR